MALMYNNLAEKSTGDGGTQLNPDGTLANGTGQDQVQDRGQYEGTGPGTMPTPPSSSSSGNGFSLPSWLTSQGNNFQGVLSNPLLAPSLAAALQQFNQAHQYTDFAERYAQGLNPFGSQRDFYQNLLKQSYTDPDIALNDPAHQRELQHGLDNVGRSQAALGNINSGNMLQALTDYSHTSDAQWLQNYRQGLITPSGANIGPESSAAMLMAGLQGRMGAENNAVGNLMVPFLAQYMRNNAPNAQNPTDPTKPGGPGGTSGVKPPGGLSNPQNVAQTIQRLQQQGFNPQTAAQMIMAVLQNPGSVDPSTLSIMQAAGLDMSGMNTDTSGTVDNTGNNVLNPDGSFTNIAPPSDGTFGGQVPINSSTTGILTSGDPTQGGNFTGNYGTQPITIDQNGFSGTPDNPISWDQYWTTGGGGDYFQNLDTSGDGYIGGP